VLNECYVKEEGLHYKEIVRDMLDARGKPALIKQSAGHAARVLLRGWEVKE
jgi:hypothetical protein